jgi:hypothetical protein
MKTIFEGLMRDQSPSGSIIRDRRKEKLDPVSGIYPFLCSLNLSLLLDPLHEFSEHYDIGSGARYFFEGKNSVLYLSLWKGMVGEDRSIDLRPIAVTSIQANGVESIEEAALEAMYRLLAAAVAPSKSFFAFDEPASVVEIPDPQSGLGADRG